MEESTLKAIAGQLACPHGEGAAKVGRKMNVSDKFITERAIEFLMPQPDEIIAEIGPGN